MTKLQDLAESIKQARKKAFELGAIDAYNDCVGGDIRAPPDGGEEVREAVVEYIRLARIRHGYLHGSTLRAYLDRHRSLV